MKTMVHRLRHCQVFHRRQSVGVDDVRNADWIAFGKPSWSYTKNVLNELVKADVIKSMGKHLYSLYPDSADRLKIYMKEKETMNEVAV